MTMSWHELLFVHYPVDPEQVRPSIPPGLELDTYDGAAWVAVVPFRMSSVGPRGLNRLPILSAFPELNVRTYVTANGKRGVWFFSLDAASAVAVEVARAGFYLSYLRARMSCKKDGEGWIHYASERRDARGRTAVFRGRYRPTGAPRRAAPGSLEEFLTERYCLYAADRRKNVYRGEIHHAPWPLSDAELVLEENTMAAAAGILLLREPPLLHFAERLDVVAWTLERVLAIP